MKAPPLLLLAGLSGIAILLGACSTISPTQAAILQTASSRYAQVALNTPREELVRALGPPQQNGATLLMWEVRYGSENFETLTVEFDSANRAAMITRRHSRWVWGPFPGGSEDLTDNVGNPGARPIGHPRQYTDCAIRPGYIPKVLQPPPAVRTD